MVVDIWVETNRHYYTYSGDRIDYMSDGYYEEVYLNAEDLAPILVDYYGIDEENAIDLIDKFDLEENLYELHADDVLEIAQEKWRCCYE